MSRHRVTRTSDVLEAAAPFSRRLRLRSDGGQAMVEFTLVLPVLLLVLLAIMKFGLMFNNYLTLTDAVRSGARQLALGRGLADPCTPAVNQTISAGKPGITLTASQVTATLTSPDSCGSGSNGNMIQGDQATISATYPCDLVVFGINFFPGCTLKATASEAIE